MTYRFKSKEEGSQAQYLSELDNWFELFKFVQNVTIGPNKFFASEEGYGNDYCDVHGTLQLENITNAIDYIIHTPSHMQVRENLYNRSILIKKKKSIFFRSK